MVNKATPTTRSDGLVMRSQKLTLLQRTSSKEKLKGSYVRTSYDYRSYAPSTHVERKIGE